VPAQPRGSRRALARPAGPDPGGLPHLGRRHGCDAGDHHLHRQAQHDPPTPEEKDVSEPTDGTDEPVAISMTPEEEAAHRAHDERVRRARNGERWTSIAFGVSALA